MKKLILLLALITTSLTCYSQLVDGYYPVAGITVSGGVITVVDAGVEYDPVFHSSDGFGITTVQMNKWDYAYNLLNSGYPHWSQVTGNDIPVYAKLSLSVTTTPASSATYNSTTGVFNIPSLPAGVVQSYAGLSAPSGYLMCDGAAVSRTTYSALFSVIGVTYGAGDGSTTFNLPDLRQRFVLTKAASGTGSVLATTGGAIDHVHSVDPPSTSSAAASGSSIGSLLPIGAQASTPSHTHDTNIAAFNSASANPPYIVLNSIIKF